MEKSKRMFEIIAEINGAVSPLGYEVMGFTRSSGLIDDGKGTNITVQFLIPSPKEEQISGDTRAMEAKFSWGNLQDKP